MLAIGEIIVDQRSAEMVNRRFDPGTRATLLTEMSDVLDTLYAHFERESLRAKPVRAP
jgi:hypothetical protein